MAEPDKKPKVQVRFYRFKNRLKEKTGGLGVQGQLTLSPEALQAAQEAFEQMAEDYPDWVSGLIGKLATWHGRCVDTPDKRHEFFSNMHDIAHDMQGQGGTFGYPLITSFAESLHNFTTPTKGEITDGMVELVKAHVDAMRAVISGRVSGDGGEMGTKLKKSLEEAIERYRNRTTDDLERDRTDFAKVQRD
ncbi:MAG: hypothetical protein ACFB22_09150 [Rhodothalassiaceae bacterium]